MKNKLIISSFIRKKIFYIYTILLVVLYSSLLILNCLLSNLQENRRNNYYDKTLATIHQSKDIYDELNSNKMLGDVKRIVYIDEDNLLSDSYKFIKEARVNNKIVIMEDNSLNDNQMNLYIHDEISNNPSHETLNFTINEKSYPFVINKIYSSKQINYVTVSSTIFDELRSLNNGHDYIFKLYNTEDIVKKELNDLQVLTGMTEDDRIITNRINQYIKLLIIFNIVSGIVFIIVIFIISNNISHDLQRNITLETLLGFNINETIKNIILRLSLLNILSLILSGVIAIVILLISNLFYKINIWLCNYYMLILILIIVIVNICYSTMKCIKEIKNS